MSIELIAILVGYALTGLVWFDLGRKIDRKANHATMMAQFQYLVQEIRRVEAGQPVPDEGAEPEREREPLRSDPRPAIAD